MICPSPMSVRRPGGSGARDRIIVPCGRCGSCLSNRRAEWSFRVGQEWKYAKSAWFITFTYSDDEIPLSRGYMEDENGNQIWDIRRGKELLWDQDLLHSYPSLYGRDIQLLIKKLRHEQEKIKEKRNLPSIPRSLKNWRFRYYLVGEYAPQTLRPHYHGLIFNMYPEVLEKIPEKWAKGMIHVEQCNGGTIHYTTKYFITNKDDSIRQMLKEQGREKEFTYMSKRPGIGYQYLEAQGWNHKAMGTYRVKNEGGYWQTMPRIYRDHLFNHKEKEERLLEIEQHIHDEYEKMDRNYEKRLRLGQPGNWGKEINKIYHKGEEMKKQMTKKGSL